MAFFHVNNIVTALLPISLIYWFLGMGVFEYPPGKPKKTFGLSYATTILVIYIVIRVDMLNFYPKGNVILAENDVISSFARDWALTTFIGMVQLVFSLAYYKKHNQCVMELNEIDGILKGMGVIRSYRPFLITQLWQFSSLLIYMISTIEIRSQYEFSQPSDRYRDLSATALVSLDTYAWVITSVNEIRFSNFNQMTEKIFKDLNKLIESLKMERPYERSDYFRRNNSPQNYGSPRSEILFSLRILYIRSSRLARQWNQTNAVFILASFIYSLWMMSLLFLEIYASLVRLGIFITRNAYWIMSVTWLVLLVVRFIIIIRSVVALMSEAHRTCGILLAHLHPIRCLRSEVLGFSMQLIQNPLRLSLLGLCPMDYSLVLELIATLATYMITVIQQTQKLTSNNSTLRAG